MAKEMGEIEVLGQIPLEPKLLMSCEQGKCFVKTHPETVTADRMKSIVDRVVKITTGQP